MHDDDPWKKLQQELGLTPDEGPAAPPMARRASPPPPQPVAETAPPVPVTEELPPLPPSPHPLIDEDLPTIKVDYVREAAAPLEPPAADDNPVEMGEAPEEIPEEPATTADGKRRRRRRRRGRKADDAPTNGEASETLPGESLESPKRARVADSDDSDEDDDDDIGAEGEDDDEDVEPIVLTDWNVPTWQELIGSLYRPER